jgi:hypothetical protein
MLIDLQRYIRDRKDETNSGTAAIQGGGPREPLPLIPANPWSRKIHCSDLFNSFSTHFPIRFDTCMQWSETLAFGELRESDCFFMIGRKF